MQVKSRRPYSDDDESGVYLNPRSRATFDQVEGTWLFHSDGAHRHSASEIDVIQPSASSTVKSTALSPEASPVTDTDDGEGVSTHISFAHSAAQAFFCGVRYEFTRVTRCEGCWLCSTI